MQGRRLLILLVSLVVATAGCISTVPDTGAANTTDNTDDTGDQGNGDGVANNETGTDDGAGANDTIAPDTDADGVPDASDNCPDAANLDQGDLDGDGIGDACDATDDRPDGDADGVPDADDNCPEDANAGQEDADGDGVGDACVEPAVADADQDGVADADDNCADVANAGQADADADGAGDACDPVDDAVDSDHDGIPDVADGCPDTPDPGQEDFDGDGVGDACDEDDTDGDGVLDHADNCLTVANAGQADADYDGVGDACDNALFTPNPSQFDTDADGVGDLADNCPEVANPEQEDADGDNVGDACDPHPNNAYPEDKDATASDVWLASTIVNPDPVAAGTPFAGAYLITNDGPHLAPGAGLEMFTPSGLTLLGGLASQAFCDVTASVMDCDVETLLAGESAIVLTLWRPSSTAAGGSIDLRADVVGSAGEDLEGEDRYHNVTDVAVTAGSDPDHTLPLPDLGVHVERRADGTGFDVTVVNTGDAPAADVSVFVALHGLGDVATDEGGNVTTAADGGLTLLSWSVGGLAHGAARTLSVTGGGAADASLVAGVASLTPEDAYAEPYANNVDRA